MPSTTEPKPPLPRYCRSEMESRLLFWVVFSGVVTFNGNNLFSWICYFKLC